MTDIDAIRKTKRYRASALSKLPADSDDVVLANVLDAALLAYDAKCEEMAKAKDLLTCGFVGDTPDYMCLLCGQYGTDHVRIQLATLRQEAATKHANAFAMFTQAGAVTAERDAAVRDAARYRWLRDSANDEAEVIVPVEGKGFRSLVNEELDAAIDAQLAALAPPTEKTKVTP